MSKPRKTVPIWTGSNTDIEVFLDQSDWELLETSCGHCIPFHVRERLIAITWIFLQTANVKPELMRCAQFRIDNISDAAETLFALLAESDHADATEYADNLIDEQIGGNDKRHDLAMQLHSLAIACTNAKIAAEEVQQPAFDKSTPWNYWIVKMSKQFEESGFPTGARKDTDKNISGGQSPFVSFVGWFQKITIPNEFRRSDHSLSALAVAIGRARETGQKPEQITDL